MSVGIITNPIMSKKYGTCTRCGKVLDAKAKFDYEMLVKLRLWRGKRKGEKII